MRAEAVEQLIEERDLWRHRATFWMNVAMFSTLRNVSEGLEAGPPEDVLNILVKSYIFTGLGNGDFAGDSQQDEVRQDELDKLFEKENEQMPWSVVAEIAAEVDVDAAQVLQDYIEHAQGGLQRAMALLGFNLERIAPNFAGVPITPQMFHEIAQGEFGPEFEKHFADKYILHCMHGPNPCQHPYDSLEVAVEGAAIDLQRGIISEILQVTHGGNLVLAKDELSRRVAEINNAGLN